MVWIYFNRCRLKPNSRKTLVTGSIPTENLPKRPSEKTTIPRRVLVRKATEKNDDNPSTSTAFVDPHEVQILAGQQISMKDVQEYIEKECFEPWKNNVKDNERGDL